MERVKPWFLGTLIASPIKQTDAATVVAALPTLKAGATGAAGAAGAAGAMGAAGAADIDSLEISSLAYRSDAVQPGSLFFCIPGSKADGHDFAADAKARGAVALAVQREVPVELPQILFEDTRLALALIAGRFYDNPAQGLCIAAVTGTNGKTTTTYLIDWICRFHLARAQSISIDEATGLAGLIGTVETRVGATRLPSKFTTPESLDLQRLLADMREAGLAHVCMEASSHAIALHRIAGISFRVAAFTNLTQDHLDFHKTMEDYFEAKAKLFDSPLVEQRVIDIDTPAGEALVARCIQNGFEPLTCGCNPKAQIRAEDIRFNVTATSFMLHTPQGSIRLSYPLIGGFNVSNVLLATATAMALGIPLQDITDSLAQCLQIPGRLERVTVQGSVGADAAQPPISVFVDYSHTPDSITKALEAIDQIKTNRTLIVFGCGGDRDATKRPLMGRAALEADFALVTSDNPRTEDPQMIIADILPGMAGGEGRFEVEPDRRRAIARALELAQPGDCVLIAGKGHEDYQLVGDKVLDFDDRLVAAEELAHLANAGHWPSTSQEAGHWHTASQEASHWPTPSQEAGHLDVGSRDHGGGSPCS
ncbi:MAG: UDP-N-acetylmuramoyl-L-alanyl-D-glutamate--2,6-diaminopimelate ligase [Coriobacteriia bacterium]|nr:UDP-N-acetylmuramoyl-L-alanyl-D-glutamate--2,6-diaminopimelate ligase [Coriobacteriia bacterium]